MRCRYMLVHLVHGQLPWLGIFHPPTVHHMKLTITDEQLFAGLPLGELYNYSATIVLQAGS